MDGTDIYRASSSLRAPSSSIWRNNGVDIFSRSSTRDDCDDEEALKWATLQKLTTYNRLKKGLLVMSNGSGENGIHEVDIQNLGVQEKKELLERLMRDSEGGNEKFLLKLRKRLDRVGIDLPKIEVRFEHLNVDAKVYVGSRALPTFLNSVWNVLEGFLNCFHILPDTKKDFSILSDVSGIIKPGRMTLLLGPPSSGKTTLLLALAGKLDPDLKISGNVTYNGHGLHEFVPHRTAAYISQNDCHIGELTVKETLAFSARCQGVGFRYEMLAELSRREKEANIKPDPDIDLFMKAAAIEGQEASVVADYVLKLLGLEICADTVVGSDMMRGVSGGQKKRVTTGEMLVGPANALFMDEISTGLDSSTTFQIVNSLRHTIHILQGTALISLLQPAPETYDLFDDVILLSDGHIVYQGPREHVLEFFELMGFKCPDRKGVADFLQEVTSKQDQEQYWLCKDEPYRFVTAQEFSNAYLGFHVGRRMRNDLRTPFDKSKSHPAALTTNKFGVKKMELLKACTSREILLMKRNAFIYIFKSTQFLIMALVAMTLFLRTNMHRDSVKDGGIYMGALFFTVTSIMFNGFAEMSLIVARLPIFYKQRDLQFYPSWAYALPSWIIKIPISLIESFLWVSFTYYTIGFDPNVGSLAFKLDTWTNLNPTSSTVNVKVWWIWGYWISPMMYGMNAIAVNEFLGHQWSRVLPNTTEPLGVIILKSRGFFPQASWYWIGVGACLGFTFLFTFSFTLALSFLNPIGKPQAVIPEEGYKGRTKESSEQGSSKDRNDRTKKHSPHSSTTEHNVAGNHNTRKGMVLPFEPHSITFDDITYSVDMPQQLKEQGITEDRLMLLQGVSGAFRPGVLTALMGVSGAGKTTLMDVLAGRKTGGYIDGHITISGYPKNQETFARISGYCEQNDIHSPNVTVYESLIYSAWLRLPSDVDSESKKMFVDEVMELVELKSLREALVGLPGVSGLSTEQRKRITIAVELVANPSIIFMDEPTSGLDARAAAIVMRTRASYWRNPPYTAARFFFTTVIALLFGTMFWDLGSKRTIRQDLFNSMGSMYSAIIFIGFQNASSVQPVVAVERTVLYRERAAGMYSSLAYALAQYGDVKDVMEDEHISVEEFLQMYFGYRRDFIGVAAAVVSGFALLFAFVFAFSIKVLNFQNR
ncbi:hypothetical protein AgCh_034255 [Apium graveolens]